MSSAGTSPIAADVYSSSGEASSPESPLERSAGKLVDFLLHDKQVAKKEMFSDHIAGRVFRAMLVNKDIGALRAIREKVQAKFTEVKDDSAVSEDLEDTLEMKIGSLLTLFAYFDPQEDTITIPVKIDDKWQMVDYSIEKIKISSDQVLSPIYAFGFTQINKKEQDPQAPPILLFRGTTYFQDSGFFSALAADLPLPWNEVGEKLFESGKEAIAEWINKHPNQEVQVYGHSLGGTLALHTGAAFNEKGETPQVRVFAYNPAGFMRLREATKNIVGRIFCHDRDAISLFGRFPEAEGLTYHRVSSDHKKGRFNAHCKVMGFDNGTTVTEGSIVDENRKICRWVLPILHRLGALLALPLVQIFAKGFAIGKFIIYILPGALFNKVKQVKLLWRKNPKPSYSGNVIEV